MSEKDQAINKNIVEASSLNTQGNVHIGDKNTTTHYHFHGDEKKKRRGENIQVFIIEKIIPPLLWASVLITCVLVYWLIKNINNQYANMISCVVALLILAIVLLNYANRIRFISFMFLITIIYASASVLIVWTLYSGKVGTPSVLEQPQFVRADLVDSSERDSITILKEVQNYVKAVPSTDQSLVFEFNLPDSLVKSYTWFKFELTPEYIACHSEIDFISPDDWGRKSDPVSGQIVFSRELQQQRFFRFKANPISK